MASRVKTFPEDNLAIVMTTEYLILFDCAIQSVNEVGRIATNIALKDVVKVDNTLYAITDPFANTSSNPTAHSLYKVDISEPEATVVTSIESSQPFYAITWSDERLWVLQGGESVASSYMNHSSIVEFDPDDLSVIDSWSLGGDFNTDDGYAKLLVAGIEPLGSTIQIDYFPMTGSGGMQSRTIEVTDPESIGNPAVANDFTQITTGYLFDWLYRDIFLAAELEGFEISSQSYLLTNAYSYAMTDSYYIGYKNNHPSTGEHSYDLQVWDKASRKLVIQNPLPKQKHNPFFNATAVEDDQHIYLAAENYGFLVIKHPE